MVSFYEAEQVKKKLFIAIQFDSHWALTQKLAFAFKRISLRPPALKNKHYKSIQKKLSQRLSNNVGFVLLLNLPVNSPFFFLSFFKGLSYHMFYDFFFCYFLFTLIIFYSFFCKFYIIIRNFNANVIMS